MSEAHRFAGSLAAGLLAALLLWLGIAVGAATDASARTLAASAALSSGAFASAALCGTLLGRRPLAIELGLRRARLPVSRLAFLALGLAALGSCLGFALELADLREQSRLGQIDGITQNASTSELVLLVAGAAIAPGVGEELLFRGFLLRALSLRLGLARGAAVSTLLFGLVHIDPVHAAAATLLGAYLAAVRIVTGSTLAAILCHILNNAAALWMGARGGPPLEILMPLSAVIALAAIAQLVRALPASIEAAAGGRETTL